MLGLRKTTATPRERKVGIIGEESPRPSSSRIIKKASTGGVKKPAAKKAMRKVVDAMVGIKRRRKSRAPSVQITEEELDARTWSENLTHHDMERLGLFNNPRLEDYDRRWCAASLIQKNIRVILQRKRSARK